MDNGKNRTINEAELSTHRLEYYDIKILILLSVYFCQFITSWYFDTAMNFIVCWWITCKKK